MSAELNEKQMAAIEAKVSAYREMITEAAKKQAARDALPESKQMKARKRAREFRLRLQHEPSLVASIADRVASGKTLKDINLEFGFGPHSEVLKWLLLDLEDQGGRAGT